MSLRATNKSQSFETNNIASFGDALQSALDAVESQNLNGSVGEPDVYIILKHNGNANGDDKLVDAKVFIGAMPQEVANYINPMP